VQASGLPAGNVQLHTTYMGGSFGSRGGGAFVAEAVEIAKQVSVPVKLTYSRDDELQHDLYRPASCVRFAAGLDANGWPSTWTARIACPTFLGLRNGVARESVEGIAAYDIPHVHVEYHDPAIGIPVGYWRSVGLSQNAFFAESFVDELAAAAKQDPVAYRRALLAKSPRAKAVLDLAAQKAGWGKPLPKGRGRGVSLQHAFGSYMAQVAEVDVAKDGAVRVRRVVCAVDCGTAVNPDTVQAQIQSGIIFGATAALYGEITLKNGRVAQTNFDSYPVLRINEAPAIEVHVVKSAEPPGGLGETGTSAVVPAIANAVFAATGKRLRKLPIDVSVLKRA
jgi:isoquinoline 1-oxidoreductase beta subunit